jgi:Flp pilus assembly protein TadD
MIARFAPRAFTVTASTILSVVALGAQSPMTVEEALEEKDRADRLFGDARYPEAYEAYHRALEAGSPDVVTDARKGKIRASLRLARFQIARAEAEALKASAEDDVDALTLHADALWGEGLFDEAEREYDAIVAAHPDAPRARFGVARSLASRGQNEGALTAAEHALTGAPKDPEILVLAGELHERLHQFDDATRRYQEYVANLPARLRGSSEVASLKVAFLKSFRGRPPAAIDGDPAAVHTVPFTLKDRKIVMAGELNGRRIDFVLDTGADRSAITRDTSNRTNVRPVVETMITGAGAPRLRRLSVARADTIRLGSMVVRNVPISILRENLPGTENWQNEKFSPMPLGLSVMIDYQRREVTFGRRIPEMPADVTLPLRLHRIPMVRGLLNDRHPAHFLVDTGGELVSINRDIAQQLEMRPTRLIPIRVFGVAGLDPTAFLLPGVNLGFHDQIQMEKLGVAVLNLRAPSVLLGFQLGGILGYKFLGGYRVALDLQRAEMRLQRF